MHLFFYIELFVFQSHIFIKYFIINLLFKNHANIYLLIIIAIVIDIIIIIVYGIELCI